ncbi:ankyrin repeat-containing domain protein [Aspergillus keveii]|uniref:Ankyrin repeat-containing domain protein n=1 Tax=Aspergillus keveii TaxID=714993 RepID=A0ABR4FM52_9EURO
MPHDVFEAVPFEIIDIILGNVPVLDYFSIKLAGSRRLTDAVRAAYSRFTKAEYLDRISKEDARQKGLARGLGRKPMEILIEKGRPFLVLDYIAKYKALNMYRELPEYHAATSYIVAMYEKPCFSTALHWAAGHGQKEIVALLLDRVNLRAGHLRQTALHYAARKNQVATAALLLDNGAYINAADDKGRTPLTVALSYKAHDVAELLRNRGGQTSWLIILHNEEWARPIVHGHTSTRSKAIQAVMDSHLHRRIVRRCSDLKTSLWYFAVKRTSPSAERLDEPRKALMHAAIRRDDIGSVKFILDEGLDPNVRIVANRTALHLAAIRGRIAITEVLLDRGADPYLNDYDPEEINRTRADETPFHYAVFRGFKALAELYLARGYPINWQNTGGQSTIWIAATRNLTSPALMQYLIDIGADVNIPDLRGNTPLLATCREGAIHSLDVIKPLVEAGADTNTPNTAGLTPLLAVMWWKGGKPVFDLVKFLLDHGARVDTQDEDGRGPLHLKEQYHADYSHSGSVALLLDRGADISRKDNRGRTPLHCALEPYILPDIATTLISRGADVNAHDNFGNTPLHLVCRSPYRGQERGRGVFLCLLEAGADPNQHNNEGDTPLHTALELEEPSMDQVLALLKHGADPNAVGSRGLTPLNFVVEQDHIDHSDGMWLIARLLDYGAAVDTRGTAGGTPLFSFLQKYELRSPAGEIVLRFIEHGADVRAKDDNGRCPLDSIRNELGHEDYRAFFYGYS